MLALRISMDLAQRPVEDVGPDVQLGLVFGDQTELGGPRGTVDIGDPGETEVAANPIYTTWTEFEEWAKSRDADADAASA